ncbi:MAG: sulfide/dihydroorotate dehydrogenase-like FAD/NAD-binding protein [Endomicrobium sp.]|jgi:ferredoxin--NADP+ reductase|nr:sulfide/dihydroorotate dehydrogenase-like FAD/NAD-binding protein [Endomicrobium sp.]
MFKILSKKEIANNIRSFEIQAPDIAKRAKAGQFVILRINDNGERIPLTIAGADLSAGSVRIIVQEAGKTTAALCQMKEGDYIKDFVGPLGHATEIKNYGTVAAVAGGVGTAEVLPVIKALKEEGNKVITIVGARCEDLLILRDEIEAASDELLIATDDGSCGRKGFVTDVLRDVVEKEAVNVVYAIGPVPMMKAVANLTKEKNIKTMVSLNPIMVDGTGMCGACRVSVDGEIKFACVEGPEFDAHKVNWEELISRLAVFKDLEKISFEKFKSRGGCKCSQG